jgi:hypothetical protein
MSRDQLRMDLFEDDRPPAPPDAPQIYVASPLTGLGGEARQTVLAWCHIVENSIDEATRGAADQWLVRTHVPARLSAPWAKDGRSDEDIYFLNSMTLWTDTDALITVGYHGGSMGAGQEFEWACGQGLPILYVTALADPISRQVRGTPADLTLKEFSSPDDLRDAVTGFLRKHRRTIEDGPRRRASARLRFAPAAAELRNSWTGRGAERQMEIAALARLAPSQIEAMLREPLALAAAPIGRVLALAAAVGVAPPFGAKPVPDLAFDQVRALLSAQAEYDWTDALTAELADAARLELARGGIRRFPLTTIDDWYRFRQQRQR